MGWHFLCFSPCRRMTWRLETQPSEYPSHTTNPAQFYITLLSISSPLIKPLSRSQQYHSSFVRHGHSLYLLSRSLLLPSLLSSLLSTPTTPPPPPLRYWQLTPSKAEADSWDSAVHQASEEYKRRMVSSFVTLDRVPGGGLLSASHMRHITVRVCVIVHFPKTCLS